MNCPRCRTSVLFKDEDGMYCIVCPWHQPPLDALPLLNENPKGGRRIGSAEEPQKRRHDARRIKRYE